MNKLEYILHKLEHLKYDLVRLVPSNILYWLTIESGLRASHLNPNQHPMSITLNQMLETLSNAKQGTRIRNTTNNYLWLIPLGLVSLIYVAIGRRVFR